MEKNVNTVNNSKVVLHRGSTQWFHPTTTKVYKLLNPQRIQIK